MEKRKQNIKEFDAQARVVCERLNREAAEKAPKWFTFALPDHILRTMNKAQYKAAMSWLRRCRRKIREDISKTVVIWPSELKMNRV